MPSAASSGCASTARRGGWTSRRSSSIDARCGRSTSSASRSGTGPKAGRPTPRAGRPRRVRARPRPPAPPPAIASRGCCTRPPPASISPPRPATARRWEGACPGRKSSKRRPAARRAGSTPGGTPSIPDPGPTSTPGATRPARAAPIPPRTRRRGCTTSTATRWSGARAASRRRPTPGSRPRTGRPRCVPGHGPSTRSTRPGFPSSRAPAAITWVSAAHTTPRLRRNGPGATGQARTPGSREASSRSASPPACVWPGSRPSCPTRNCAGRAPSSPRRSGRPPGSRWGDAR